MNYYTPCTENINYWNAVYKGTLEDIYLNDYLSWSFIVYVRKRVLSGEGSMFLPATYFPFLW